MSGHGSRAGPADYTTLAVIDGDARGMRSSDYAAVVRAADGFRIAGLVSQPGGVYVAPGVHAIAVRNASGSRWSWGFAGADGASATLLDAGARQDPPAWGCCPSPRRPGELLTRGDVSHVHADRAAAERTSSPRWLGSFGVGVR